MTDTYHKLRGALVSTRLRVTRVRGNYKQNPLQERSVNADKGNSNNTECCFFSSYFSTVLMLLGLMSLKQRGME